MLQGKTHVIKRPSDPCQNAITLIKSDALPANASKNLSNNINLVDRYSPFTFSDNGTTPVKIVRSHSTLRDRHPVRTLNFEYIRKLPALERQCITCLDISGRNFNDEKMSHLVECRNLTFINASDNTLSLRCFKQFEKLRTLDLSLNEIYGLKSGPDTLLNVVELDLSFNFVRPDDLLVLGTFPSLRVLWLTGNEIAHIPEQPLKLSEETYMTTDRWFAVLEELHLNSNKLKDAAVIASLSRFPRLRYLNLACNEFTAFPVLHLREHFEDESKHSLTRTSPQILALKTKHSQTPKPNITSAQSFSHKKTIVTTASSLHSQKQHPHFIIESSFRKASLKKDQMERTLSHNTEAEAVQERNHVRKKPFYGSLVDYEEVVVPSIVTKFVHRVLKKRQSQRQSSTTTTVGKPLFHKSSLRRLQNVGLDSGTFNRPLGSNSSYSSMSITFGENSLFPGLEKLDLSFNHIRDDVQILPVIVCPKLQELVLGGNPITTQKTKISREVEEILIKTCGINIQIERVGIKDAERRVGERLRKKITRKIHKVDTMPIRPEYKIKSKLPSLKKLDVDAALRKQREEDRQRDVATSIFIKRDTQSEEETTVLSGKIAPDTSLDFLSTGPHSEDDRSEVFQHNNPKETSADSCFVPQLELVADAAVKSEESVVQTVPYPILPDLDMSMDRSTLPNTIQDCLTELRELVHYDGLHLAKTLKPPKLNKKNEPKVTNAGFVLALEERSSPVLRVSNPFALQLSQFTAVAMKTENLSTVIFCIPQHVSLSI
uniref:X-ray radiation resistance-associated protein 1 n=3 Tax=Schistocephalus solidus TaxID=70667 RepID=A0A0V0JBI4_SCHSO